MPESLFKQKKPRRLAGLLPDTFDSEGDLNQVTELRRLALVTG